ncbi:MAG: ABC transporter ATP-binding protein [Acidobacteriota bacterium]|nr:MAG: ABC transporter ATP-binding protein [Acidobacteriota bacterium]
MIEVHELRMVYRSVSLRYVGDFFSAPVKHVALGGVSFEVREGETAAVVGRNSAGKTTLLKILAGLVLPASGSARVGGFDVLKEPVEAKRRIGFMGSQERSFYWRLTARQNLQFFAALYDLRGGAAAARVEEVSGMLDVGEHLDRPFRSLSSGVQQRMGLARALLHRPRLLLLDEPTRSLDADSAARFLELLERISREESLTVFFATHTARDLRLARRIHVLDRGRFTWRGTSKEFLAAGGEGSGPAPRTMEEALEHMLSREEHS